MNLYILFMLDNAVLTWSYGNYSVVFSLLATFQNVSLQKSKQSTGTFRFHVHTTIACRRRCNPCREGAEHETTTTQTQAEAIRRVVL